MLVWWMGRWFSAWMHGWILFRWIKAFSIERVYLDGWKAR